LKEAKVALVALMASIIATVVPTIVYVFVLWWFDRYEKEPIGLLAIAFFWGAMPAVVLSIVGEIVAGVPLATLDAASSEVIGSSAIAPFVEESVKGLIVFVLYWIFYKEFDSPVDGIIYGALVGHGFGMTENLFYFLGAWVNGGWGSWSVVVFVRAFVFGLNHAFFTSLTGLGLYLARMSRSVLARGVFALLGLSAAMLFHAIHNLGIVMAQATCLLSFLVGALSDWGGVLIVFVILITGMINEKHWITSELKEEIEIGLIDQHDYVMAQSYTERMMTQIDAILRGNWRGAQRVSRLGQTLTELAFRKYQMRMRGNDYTNEIRLLRQKVAAIKASANA
jgi:RsiW-degrading membrane proteinase PrsW (M82 family)